MFNQSHARQLLFLLINYLDLEYAKSISKDSAQYIADLILEEKQELETITAAGTFLYHYLHILL